MPSSKKQSISKCFLVSFLIMLVVGGCGISPEETLTSLPSTQIPTATRTTRPTLTPIPAATPSPVNIWISPSVPEKLISSIHLGTEVIQVSERREASWLFEVVSPEDASSRWVYVLVAPFPSLVEEVSFGRLQEVWHGNPLSELTDRPLLVSPGTLAAFSTQWGSPAVGAVETLPSDDLLSAAWEAPYSWAIIPFEELEPRWKVVRVSGRSPFDQDFVPWEYPLTLSYGFVGVGSEPLVEYPANNYEPSHLTTIILTGTTALVRNTAARMVEKGIEYPAGDIGFLLREADILHISNEVPFYSKCPAALPVRAEMRFCADPSFIDLLDFIGTDIVELTGNHVLDWGQPALTETLMLYEDHNLPIYGGGRDAVSAQAPLELDHNGNRFVFIGCNPAGPANILATSTQGGAARCDFAVIEEQLVDYQQRGVIPIFTFQHFEVDDYVPTSAQRADFERVAQAGAVIISGSQAHFPQGFRLLDNSFIHYGLGNLFFDQMDDLHRRSFIDRHVFYEGKHISTEVIPLVLEDFARPRFMDPVERDEFLTIIFSLSDWSQPGQEP